MEEQELAKYLSTESKNSGLDGILDMILRG